MGRELWPLAKKGSALHAEDQNGRWDWCSTTDQWSRDEPKISDSLLRVFPFKNIKVNQCQFHRGFITLDYMSYSQFWWRDDTRENKFYEM
jgi:hypothetical protein